MEFERARLEREGAVAILSMNHPEVLNAASAEMLKGLTDALHALAGSSDRTRCLIITGSMVGPHMKALYCRHFVLVAASSLFLRSRCGPERQKGSSSRAMSLSWFISAIL